MPNIIDISEVLLEMGLVNDTDFQRAVANTSITRAEGAIKRFLGYDPVQRTRTEWYTNRDFQSVGRGEAIWNIAGNQAVLERLAEASTRKLQVQHIPVRSVTELRIDYDGRSGTSSGAFSEAAKTEGVDFWPNYERQDDDGNTVCSDGILYSFGRWPLEPGAIQMIYVGGYSKAELHGQSLTVDASPIIDAVINEAVRRALKIFTGQESSALGGTGFTPGPVVSERLGDYSYQLGGGGSRGTTTDRKVGGASDLLPETREMLSDFVNWGWRMAS
jgi:hypothetical protein